MSIAGKKDKLAAGGRSMVIAGGIGESPLLRKIQEQGEIGMEDRAEVVPAFTPAPKPPQRRFIPNPGVYLVRQVEAENLGVGSIEEGLQADAKGILLVQDDKNKERPAEGIIVEAGSGTIHKVGTYVAFGKYAGTEFKLNGEILLFMKDEDIFGSIVIPGDEPIETEVEYEILPGSTISEA